MRPIGVKDIDGILIFEGDTLEITDPDEIRFRKDFMEMFNIDRVTFYVVERDYEVGVELHIKFYSNGTAITREQQYEFLVKNKDPEKVLNDFISEELLSNDFIFVLKTWHDLSTFIHSFKERDKKIIASKLTDKEKEALSDFKAEDLVIKIGDETYPAKTEFIVKLSKEAKKVVLEAHNSLYGGKETMSGDFTHASFKVNRLSLYDYDLRSKPVNEKEELTWYSKELKNPEFRDFTKAKKQEMQAKHEEWVNCNPKLTEEEVSLTLRKRFKVLKESLKLLEESNAFMQDEVVEDLFIGLMMSKNLIVFFEDKGCEIIVK